MRTNGGLLSAVSFGFQDMKLTFVATTPLNFFCKGDAGSAAYLTLLTASWNVSPNSSNFPQISL